MDRIAHRPRATHRGHRPQRLRRLRRAPGPLRLRRDLRAGLAAVRTGRAADGRPRGGPAARATRTSATRAATSCPPIAGVTASARSRSGPARYEPAWDAVEPNTFGTNEFIGFCRQLGAEPYLVVNAGDGDMREARDWVEYCNGTQAHGADQAARGARLPRAAPGALLGHRQRGRRALAGRLQDARRSTPGRTSSSPRSCAGPTPASSCWPPRCRYWEGEPRRAHPAAPEAGRPTTSTTCRIHWYVGDPDGDLPAYLAVSELIEDRLTAIEGLSRAADPAAPAAAAHPHRRRRVERLVPGHARRRATRPSTGSRRPTTWPTRWSWRCTSTPSSATRARCGWPTWPSS